MLDAEIVHYVLKRIVVREGDFANRARAGSQLDYDSAAVGSTTTSRHGSRKFEVRL
jgi:hypothetical protein